MTGTIREILTIRRALTRAFLAAERSLANAKTKELRRLYATDLDHINAAARIVEQGESELTLAERERIDAMLEGLRVETEVLQ